jgi:uncharacterized protein YbjT (DUF2867 family)
MPVVVTGASGLVGMRAVEALTRTSPEVRAYVRNRAAVDGLRALGAKVAVGWIGDVDNLATVMAGAHTVVHLVGGLDFQAEEEFKSAILDTTGSVTEAAARAGVRLFVFLSYPGADTNAANPFLRFKGMAEDVVARSGMEFVVLRSTLIYGPGSRWLERMRARATRRPAVVIGTGRQVMAPVFVDDVAAAIVAVDDRAEPRSGTWGLQGPDRVTADELAALLGGSGGRVLHVPPSAGSVLSRLAGPRDARAALDLLASDSVADPPDAAAEFGVSLTPLRMGLAASEVPARAGGPPE